MRIFSAQMVVLSAIAVLALAAACAPGLVPLATPTEVPTAPPTAGHQPSALPAKKLKIAYIRPTNEPYYKYGFEGARMIAPMMNAEIVGYVSEMKPGRELASIEDAINEKVDGIVLIPATSESLLRSLNMAFEAKIPVYTVLGYNKGLMDKMVGTVQADCNLSGSVIGKWVADNIPQGEIAVIMGQSGRGDAECYRDAFKSQTDKNPKLELVASVPGDWNRQKAFDQMQNLIVSYPNLKAVFVENEDMALGAIQALKEAGKDSQVAIVSQNGAPYGLESIANGGIKATVGWSPSQEAQLAVRQLIEFIQGKKQPWQLTITPMTFITMANAGDATPWQPTQASTKEMLGVDLTTLKHEFTGVQ